MSLRSLPARIKLALPPASAGLGTHADTRAKRVAHIVSEHEARKAAKPLSRNAKMRRERRELAARARIINATAGDPQRQRTAKPWGEFATTERRRDEYAEYARWSETHASEHARVKQHHAVVAASQADPNTGYAPGEARPVVRPHVETAQEAETRRFHAARTREVRIMRADRAIAAARAKGLIPA